MAELSPAAQAVRDAVLATYADSIPKDDALWALERVSTVAALRAAVGQVRTNLNLKRHIARREAEMLTLNKILAIATELEDAND